MEGKLNPAVQAGAKTAADVIPLVADVMLFLCGSLTRSSARFVFASKGKLCRDAG
jgi:hypothetical protein